MLSKELESILQVIYADARMQRYEFIGIEHLLLSLVQESDEVRAVLKSCGANIPVLAEQLAISIEENTPYFLGGGAFSRTTSGRSACSVSDITLILHNILPLAKDIPP